MGWTSFGQNSAKTERKSQKVSACTACRIARGVFCALVNFFKEGIAVQDSGFFSSWMGVFSGKAKSQ